MLNPKPTNILQKLKKFAIKIVFVN